MLKDNYWIKGVHEWGSPYPAIEFMRLRHSTTSYTAIHGAAAILSGKNMFYNIHEVDVGHSQAVGAAGSPKLAQSTNCWVLTNWYTKA